MKRTTFLGLTPLDIGLLVAALPGAVVVVPSEKMGSSAIVPMFLPSASKQGQYRSYLQTWFIKLYALFKTVPMLVLGPDKV